MAGKGQTIALLPQAIQLGLPNGSRKAIERQIDYLIDLLDQVDGDADLEEDHEDYDACDLGEPQQHSDDSPKYGINQANGPLGWRWFHAQG